MINPHVTGIGSRACKRARFSRSERADLSPRSSNDGSKRVSGVFLLSTIDHTSRRFNRLERWRKISGEAAAPPMIDHHFSNAPTKSFVLGVRSVKRGAPIVDRCEGNPQGSIRCETLRLVVSVIGALNALNPSTRFSRLGTGLSAGRDLTSALHSALDPRSIPLDALCT